MSILKPAFYKGMTPQIQVAAQRQLERARKEIGKSEAVERFLRSYGKVRVQALYAFHLTLYFRWLKRKGVTMSPDELIVDNLRSIYKSEPEDVGTKRKHRGWLEEYVNVNERMKNCSLAYRASAVSAVSKFYEKNDSPLFGKVSVTEEAPEAPDKALRADDIRKVLRALPITLRTPLLCIWQSSCEMNRILGLRWKDLEELEKGEYPLKLSFFGRKGHKRAWHAYPGRDSIQHLKMWREKWVEFMGRSPTAEDLVFIGKQKGSGLDTSWLNAEFKRMAMKLHRQGLVGNGNPSSWRTHMLLPVPVSCPLVQTRALSIAFQFPTDTV